MSESFGRGYWRILDLGVYRCSEEQCRAEQEPDCRADCERYIRVNGLDPARNNDVIEWKKTRWKDRYGGPWLGNEMVSLVSLSAGPSHHGAGLYFVNERPARRMTRGRLWLVGKLFDFNVMFPGRRTSREIYKELCRQLRESFPDSPKLKGRTVDFTPLNALGPHVDWVLITSPNAD